MEQPTPAGTAINPPANQSAHPLPSVGFFRSTSAPPDGEGTSYTNRDLCAFQVEVVLADTWLRIVQAGPTEERLYREWLAAGCPKDEPEPFDEGIHLYTAHSMGALHYLTMDAQVRQYMDLRNLIRDPDLSPLPAHLQSSSRPFEQHLFTKLKLLMAQREQLLGRFANLLRILSFYDDILLDIVEGVF